MATHWIIRVGNGKNLDNSKFPFWGVKRGCLPLVKKMKTGDVLWFMTSKDYGGKMVAFAEFTQYYDRKDEPLLSVHTLSNEEQGWTGDELWDIQIHYVNMYTTEAQNIKAVIQGAFTVIDYDSLSEKNRSKINGNLRVHYENFKFYAEPKNLLC
jgi:hypothetical protein